VLPRGSADGGVFENPCGGALDFGDEGKPESCDLKFVVSSRFMLFTGCFLPGQACFLPGLLFTGTGTFQFLTARAVPRFRDRHCRFLAMSPAALSPGQA